jgi:hypothetical protein
MKPFILEPGCIYMGLTGPYREIVKCGRQRVEYRVLHAQVTRECSADQFREWAVSDVTETLAQNPRCPLLRPGMPQDARKGA